MTRIKNAFFSIRWKIILAYLLVICGLFYFVTVSLTRLVGEYMYTQRLSEEERAATTLAVEVSVPLREQQAQALYELTLAAADGLSARVLVVNPYGAVLADSLSALNGTRLDRSEVAIALTRYQSAHGYYPVSLSGEAELSGLYACPVVDRGQLLGAVVLVSASQDLYDSLMDIQTRMLFWMVIAMALVFFVTLAVTHFIFRPINEMNDVIARMSRGDLSLRQLLADETRIQRSPGAVEFALCDAPSIDIKTDTGDVEGSLLTE